MRKSALFTTLFILASLFASKGQTTNTLSATETTRIDSIATALMKKYNITGASIGIVDHNNVVLAKGYGFADKKNKVAADENTIYGIGSMSKTFTAMAIMKLHEEGKIDLEKSAEFYIPELTMKSLVENGPILKIKELLTHTSGLPDDIMNGMMCSNNVGLWSIIPELNQQVLAEPGGWKMNYSNVGFDLLGCVVERVSGMKYEDYIKKYIFDKTGMDNSGFYLASERANVAKGYRRDSVETAEPIIRDVPAGRIMSNVTEMNKFMLMMLNNGKGINGDVVGQSSIALMESDHLGDVKLNVGERFGYGMFVEKMYNEEDSVYGFLTGHAGDTHIYHSSFFMIPKMGIGFVILSNSEKGHGFCNTMINKFFKEYLEKVRGMKLHPSKALAYSSKALNYNITDIKDLRGTYSTGSDESVTVKTHGKRRAVFIQKDAPHLLLTKQADNSFSVKVRLFKIFPVKVKELSFTFKNVDGHIYIKQLNNQVKRVEYILEKDEAGNISKEWKNAVGKYKVINACEGNLHGLPTELKIQGNKLVLMLQFPEGEKDTRGFRPVSDSVAAVDGISRGCGMIMKILPNGHLYFSGYEMVKEEALTEK